MSSRAARPRVSKATAMGSLGVLRVEDTIENQPHVPNPELVELAARALGLRERGRIGTRHQDERRLCLIAQRRVRGGIERLLRLETRQRAETRRAAHVGFDEGGPGRRQLEEAECVTGGRRVEDHVVERGCGVRVAEQFRELIERGDLDGART